MTQAIDLIKRFEGYRPKPYLDAVGVGTIGFGSTEITEAEAEYLAKSYIDRQIRPFIDKHITVKLNINQWAALVSFLYNIGTSAFRDSHSMKVLNAGDYEGFADRLLLWNKAGGKVLPGLTKRREAERALFLTPV